ncbi:hypothetical protein CDD83_7875 [Cordyceps sp. RAO-2017]|nr:hypothetical protein CDD83_7875 [Cordyceps sp. RAO-2017]
MDSSGELPEQVGLRQGSHSEPPPYQSPLRNGDDDDQLSRSPSAAGQTAVALDEARLAEPLNAEELYVLQSMLESQYHAYQPGVRYLQEAEEEKRYMQLLREESDKHRDLLLGRAGEQREMVLSRHRIKKRWQSLGVWNPDWGIPGRVNEGPQDNAANWKWKWQGDTPFNGIERSGVNPEHPNSRAIQLRQGLRRGQRGPLPPRHNLTADTTQSAAESFIISRPWYTYMVDIEDEETRSFRLQEHYVQSVYEETVAERWRESGDWDPWGRGTLPGWKWRHESPSPEPESLSEIELTPSEIDAMDAIAPPRVTTAPKAIQAGARGGEKPLP